MDVSRSAPVLVRDEVDIAAAPEMVWRLLADINGWPNWNPAVTKAELQGELAPGSIFRWRAGPGTITSVLRETEPGRVLAWTGSTFGINAVHIYRIEPIDGKTRVFTAESWEGLPVRLLRGRMQRTLDRSLRAGLKALKAAAERQVGT